MKVCCIKTDSIPKEIKAKTASFSVPYGDVLKPENIVWVERKSAETDSGFQQIIPYVLLQKSDGTFACYERHGNEKRLHGKWSCGIGGHIDEGDEADSLDQIVMNGMRRELGEELKNFTPSKIRLSYLGIINETESEVGQMHLGLVFIAKCEDGYTPVAADELKNMEWKSGAQFENLEKELWTDLAFTLLKTERRI